MTTYKDDDLVYIDPYKKEIIGPIEWTESGEVKRLEMKEIEKPEKVGKDEDPKGSTHRKRSKRYYPWGTYRTVKKLYRIGGKESEVDAYQSFDEALGKALQEPFWD